LAKRDRFLFTSESVTEGHPDKIADQIRTRSWTHAWLRTHSAGGLRDADLHRAGGDCGEITTKAYVDFQSIVRGTVGAIGYDNALYGFDSNTCAVISTINKQSSDIAMVWTQAARRPGHDVRVCDQRDPGTDADADLAGAEADAQAL